MCYQDETISDDIPRLLSQQKSILSDADMVVPHISMKISNLSFGVTLDFGFVMVTLILDTAYAIGFKGGPINKNGVSHLLNL